MPDFSYACYNCRCESPEGDTRQEADIKAFEAGWHIGHFNSQGEIVCPDCTHAIWDAVPMVPLHLTAPGAGSTTDEAMPWERVSPPVWWETGQVFVVADRCLPDGTRQHMVPGHVPSGVVIGNAQVIGEADVPGAQFSEKPSHLSALSY